MGRPRRPAHGIGDEEDPLQRRQADQRARPDRRRRRAPEPRDALGPQRRRPRTGRQGGVPTWHALGPHDRQSRVHGPPRGRAAARCRREGGDPDGLATPHLARAVDHAHGHLRVRLGPGRERESRGSSTGSTSRTTRRWPTRLGGPNPTITCQALATRTAEKILVNEFGGAPFVATGSPTVSTDPSITAALASVGL